MNILRLSTLSLTLAVAVFALGYNSSFADKPDSGDCLPEHCDHGGEDPSGLTYTVDLRGTFYPTFDMRGAFQFEGGLESATLEFKGTELRGDVDVTMKRAGTDPTCMSGEADDQLACIVWNDVFDLCGLLGLVGTPTDVTQFMVQLGDWSVGQGGDREGIFFEFEIPASLSPLSDNPLSASLHLFRTCTSPCGTIPTTATDGTPKRIVLTNSQIHLKGKAGVTHKAACHGDKDSLAASGSTLVITAN